MKIKLYLETSVFGFYFDKYPHNKDKKESTIKMFDLIKQNIYEGFISGVTIKEINNIPEKFQKDFLSLIDKYKLKIIEYGNYEKENIEYITNLLVKKKIVPEEMLDDALHISSYIFSSANYLISWNCKHITNAKVLREIKVLLLNEGINKNIEIYTPMEVIYV
jgi:hypothetical protein